MALEDKIEEPEEPQKGRGGRKKGKVPIGFNGIHSFDWSQKKPVTYDASPAEFARYVSTVESANRSRVLSAPNGLYNRNQRVQKGRSKTMVRKGLITKDELTKLSDIEVNSRSDTSDLIKRIKRILSKKARSAVTLSEDDTEKYGQLLFINVPDTYDLQELSLKERIPYSVCVYKEDVSKNTLTMTTYLLENDKEYGTWKYEQQKKITQKKVIEP